ncbi:PASTA domain-containing protein [Nonomuraea rosea]|uniref:PASTA domain-containing protein n=1 Tax=Nonomuraea rosea TaxID=638574 RepID=UPI0031E66AEE
MRALPAVPRRLRAIVAATALGTALIGGAQAAQASPAATAFTTASAVAAAPLCVTQNGIRYCEMPDIVGQRLGEARTTLGTYGFGFGVQHFVIDHICNHIGEVARQKPAATVGSVPRVLYPAGTSVEIWIWQLPSHPCP